MRLSFRTGTPAASREPGQAADIAHRSPEQDVERLRQRGNDAFQRGSYNRAADLYNRVHALALQTCNPEVLNCVVVHPRDCILHACTTWLNASTEGGFYRRDGELMNKSAPLKLRLCVAKWHHASHLALWQQMVHLSTGMPCVVCRR